MKAIIAILSVALVALGGSAIYLWQQLDANRQQVADLKAQVDTTAASAPQAPPIAPSPSLPIAEPAATVPTAAPAPAPAPAPDADGKALEEQEQLRRALTALKNSPGIQAQTKAAMKRNISNRYPDVGEVLGLSSSEVDQLLDLLYKQSDFSAGDPDSVARMQQAAQDELVSLLGSKYAKWEEYKTEAPTRRHVKDLTAALDAAGTPLTDAQNDALIQALVAEERRNSQLPGDRPIPGQYYRFTPEATQNLLNASSAYLTPQQMETYRQVLERASNQETRSRNVMNDVISRDPRILESLRGGQQ